MGRKPKYIRTLEKGKEMMSSVEFDIMEDSIDKFISDKSFILVWSKGTTDSQHGKIHLNKKIFKTKQGFYLYLSTTEQNTSIVVYYNQDQQNELIIFISQLLKQYKNGKAISK